MTANRDKRIWAVAQGERPQGRRRQHARRSSRSRPTSPGPGPNGKHLFLDGEEAIKKMTVAKGLKVNLFASEKEFPELVNPVQMAFDTKGRLWVAVWPTYPHWKPKEAMNDKLLILEDTDGDGKADKMHRLRRRPAQPDRLRVLQRRRARRPGARPAVPQGHRRRRQGRRPRARPHGLDSADTHHTANSFVLDPGGALYFQEGTFHHTQVETPYGPPRALRQRRRLPLRAADAEVRGLRHLRLRQPARPRLRPLGPGHRRRRHRRATLPRRACSPATLDFPHKHNRPPQVYQQRTRPCPGIEILSSRHFPDDDAGQPAGRQRHRLPGHPAVQDRATRARASPATELEPIVSSTDPNFRPSDLEIGPDGALYFIDWQNPIIGHMQHNLRDPSRDRDARPHLPRHLRGPAAAQARRRSPASRSRSCSTCSRSRRTASATGPGSSWAAATAEEVIAARREVGRRPRQERRRATSTTCSKRSGCTSTTTSSTSSCSKRVLGSPDFRARAAATRVLCYWRDRVPDALDLLKTLAADEHPRVRLEAVRAASFFTVPEAVEVAADRRRAADRQLPRLHPRRDDEDARARTVKKAIAEGKPIAFTTDAGGPLLPRERQHRGPAEDEARPRASTWSCSSARASATRTAARRWPAWPSSTKQGRAAGRCSTRSASHDDQRGRPGRERRLRPGPAAHRPAAAELAGVRGDLEKLATGAKLPVIRQIGFVALIAADGSVDKAWALADEVGRRRCTTCVDAMPLIRDPALRAGLYPKVEPLLDGLPTDLAVAGRRQGRRRPLRPRRAARQAADADAGRGRGLQRRPQRRPPGQGDAEEHRQRRRREPGHRRQHERRLRRRRPDAHARRTRRTRGGRSTSAARCRSTRSSIYNRTDGDLGKRLERLHAQGARRATATSSSRRTKLPPPTPKATFELGGESARAAIVRRAAMNALTSVRGKEAPTFKALAQFVTRRRRPARRHPRPAAHPRGLLAARTRPSRCSRALLAYVRKVPVAERTSPAALDALQLGRRPGGAAAGATRPGRSARSWASWASASSASARCPTRCASTRSASSSRPASRSRSCSRTPTSCRTTSSSSSPGALEEIGMLAEATAHPARRPRAAVRPALGQGPAREPAAPAARVAEAELHRADASRASIRTSAPTPATGGGCTGRCTSSKTSTSTWRTPRRYLAKHPLPIKDDLLKFNRPRKEWKFDDLASSVAELDHGRSFANGKQMFQVATCVACHKLNGVGSEFGPDLTKLDPKRTPVDILKHILEPSAKIDEKYPTYIFETESRQGRHRPDPRGDARGDQGDREPAGEGRAAAAQDVRDRSTARSRRRRSCPRGCSTS